MHKKTIKLGINFITAGIALITLVTFFHGHVASLLFLSQPVESRFVYLSLFWGGTAGCIGIMMSVIGFMRTESGIHKVNLISSLIMLFAVILLFFFLFYSSFKNPERPGMRPGETLII